MTDFENGSTKATLGFGETAPVVDTEQSSMLGGNDLRQRLIKSAHATLGIAPTQSDARSAVSASKKLNMPVESLVGDLPATMDYVTKRDEGVEIERLSTPLLGVLSRDPYMFASTREQLKELADSDEALRSYRVGQNQARSSIFSTVDVGGKGLEASAKGLREIVTSGQLTMVNAQIKLVNDLHQLISADAELDAPLVSKTAADTAQVFSEYNALPKDDRAPRLFDRIGSGTFWEEYATDPAGYTKGAINTMLQSLPASLVAAPAGGPIGSRAVGWVTGKVIARRIAAGASAEAAAAKTIAGATTSDLSFAGAMAGASATGTFGGDIGAESAGRFAESKDLDDALAYGLILSSVDAAVNAPFGFAGGLVPFTGGALKKAGSSVAVAGLAGLGGGFGATASNSVVGRETTLGEFALEAVLELGTVPGEVAVSHLTEMRDAYYREQAKQKVETLTQGSEQFKKFLTAVNKLEAPNAVPETFNQLFDHLAAVHNDGEPVELSIDFAKLAEILGEEKLAEVRKKSKALDEQFDQASQIPGSTVTLPIGDFAVHISEPGIEAALAQNVRHSVSDMSTAEAKAEVESFNQSAQQVYDTLSPERQAQVAKIEADELAALNSVQRFSSDVNKQYAKFTASFFSTMAHRLGMTPEAFYGKYKAKYSNAEVGAQKERVDAAPNVPTTGKPLQVDAYHGSREDVGDFSDFEKASDGATFFTEKIEAAKPFGNVSRRKISMQNPMVLTNKELEDLVTDEESANDVIPRDKIAGLVAQARAAGHDGLVIRDFYDTGADSTAYLPFTKEQILESDSIEQTANLRRKHATLDRKRETLRKFGLKPGKNYKTREVAAALERRTQEKWGTIPMDDRSQETIDTMSKWMVDEIMFEMEDVDNSGVGWYTEKYQKAIDALGEIFPELLTDQNARNHLTLFVAITSDGQKVVPNFAMATDIYANFRASLDAGGPAVFRTSIGHSRKGAMNQNLERVKELYELYGDSMHDKLMESRSVAELAKIARAEKKKFSTNYPAKANMPMAALTIGAKLGAFYGNLRGDSELLTMDRWWSRTINRYRGQLTTKASESSLARFREMLDNPTLAREETLQAAVEASSAIESRGFKTQLALILGRSQPNKKSEEKVFFADIETLRDPAVMKSRAEESIEALERAVVERDKKSMKLKGKPDNQFRKGAAARIAAIREAVNTPVDILLAKHALERTANTIRKQEYENLNDAPGNASDRMLMIAAAKAAAKRLKRKGVSLSIADIQAALWYYEKKLYNEQGAVQSGSKSFLDAAQEAVFAIKRGSISDLAVAYEDEINSEDEDSDDVGSDDYIDDDNLDQSPQENDTREGRKFKDFFASITSGTAGAPKTSAASVKVLDRERNPEVVDAFMEHSGNFDRHIEASIPGFRDIQFVVAEAITKTYSNADVLDIGASEGALVKTVAQLGDNIRAIGLDPNPEMAKTFAEKSTVPGATYDMAALGSKEQEGTEAWVEEDGTQVPYFKPDRKFQVVHEAMVFQFISNDRDTQVARVAELLADDGVAIFEEKFVKGDGLDESEWDANEKVKNAFKDQFFSKEDIAAKADSVLVGMNKNMVAPGAFEATLAKNFKHVHRFWKSGNFMGYVASNDEAKFNEMVANIGDTHSPFSEPPTDESFYQESQPDLFEEVQQIEDAEMESAKAKGLDMSLEARLKRAKEMGFSTVQRWYHATNTGGFTSFRPFGEFKTKNTGVFLTDAHRMAGTYMRGLAQDPKIGRPDQVIADPEKYGFKMETREDGWLYVTTPQGFEHAYKTEEDFADDIRKGDVAFETSPAMYELFVRLNEDNVLEIDWQGRSWSDGPITETVYDVYEDRNGKQVFDETYFSKEEADARVEELGEGSYIKEHYNQEFRTTDNAARFAREQGYDAVRILNVVDPGPYSARIGAVEGTVLVVMDPKNLRSVDAAFDPEFADSDNILAQSDMFADDRIGKSDTFETTRLVNSKGDTEVVKLPNVDSSGRQIAHTKQSLENFWKNFEDAEAVDEEGRPIALYHGTQKDIREFKAGLPTHNNYGILGDVATTRAATFLTPDRTFAEVFAENPDDVPEDEYAGGYEPVRSKKREFVGGDNVLPVYLASKNLADLREGLSYEVEQAAYKQGISLGWMHNIQNTWELFDGEDGDAFVKALVAAGYDGAVFVEEHHTTGGDVETYAAFKTEQIKSAIGNKGTFDTSKKSIVEQGSDGPLGAFHVPSKTISQLEKANLSTFLHELGHFYFETLGEIAAQDGAPQQIVDDFNALLKFVGYGGTAAQYMKEPVGRRREGHEKVAESFEQYLQTGKAPSLELQPVFSTFATWLTKVYKSLQRMLLINKRSALNEEVSAVFDRMLATDEAIAEAVQIRGLVPQFKSAEEAGMTPEGWAEYQSYGMRVVSDAEETLRTRMLRDMRWLANARAKALREVTQDAKDKRRAVHDEVDAEVSKMRVYRLMDFLRRGKLTDANGVEQQNTLSLGTTKLNSEAVKAMLPESLNLKPFGTGKYGMLAADGMDLGMAAGLFGYESADEMLRDILAAENKGELVAGLTDQRMLERHGDIATQEGLQRAADEALANEAHIAMVATELASHEKRVGQVSLIRKAAKYAAMGLLDKSTVRNVRPDQAAASAARARKASAKALKSGKRDEAAAASRNELLHLELQKQGLQIRRDVDAFIRSTSRIFKGKAAEIAKRRDLDMVNAARAVLAAYGIGPKGAGAASAQYMLLLAQYNGARADDIKTMVSMLPVGTDGSTKEFKDLTVAEFRQVADVVNGIYEMAKKEKQVLIDGQKLALDDVATVLVNSILEKNNGELPPLPGYSSTTSRADEIKSEVLGALALLNRVEPWAKGMGKAWTTYIVNPVFDALSVYKTKRNEVTGAYLELLKTIAPTITFTPIKAPELNGFTFSGGVSEIVHAIAHTGNPSNAKKLIVGRGWGTADENGVVDMTAWNKFINRMIQEKIITKDHFDFVQAVWDLMEAKKADMQKAHHAMYGYYFSEITAAPINTPFGTYRGGYIPAIADPLAAPEAAQKREAEAMLHSGNSFMVPTTGKGMTESRVEYNRPLELDLRVLASHLDKSMRFTYLEPAIRDVNKILTNKRVARALNGYDSGAISKMLNPWLQVTARQTATTPGKSRYGDKLQATLRQRAGLIIMFGNVVNTLQQITGFSLAWVRTPAGALARANVKMLTGNRKAMIDFATSKSGFLKDRMEGQSYEMAAAVDAILLNASPMENVQEFFKKHAYFMQQAAQNYMDAVVWTAAYDTAVARKATDKEAVRAADETVRITQGSFAPEDISAFESNIPFVRLFIQFFGYFNMQYNLLKAEGKLALALPGYSEKSKRLTFLYFAGLAIPAFVGALIAMGPPDDEDEDDAILDDWMAMFFGSQARTLAAMFPVVGQTGNYVAARLDNKVYNDRVSLAPVVSLSEAAVGGLAFLGQGTYNLLSGESFVEEVKKKQVKDTLTLVGMIAGLPTGQVSKVTGYLMDVEDGKAAPEGVVDYAIGLTTGK